MFVCLSQAEVLHAESFLSLFEATLESGRESPQSEQSMVALLRGKNRVFCGGFHVEVESSIDELEVSSTSFPELLKRC